MVPSGVAGRVGFGVADPAGLSVDGGAVAGGAGAAPCGGSPQGGAAPVPQMSQQDIKIGTYLSDIDGFLTQK